MIEIGAFFLVFAFVTAILQTVTPFILLRHSAGLIKNGLPSVAAKICFLSTGIAFICLTYAYVTSDFSVLNVAQNSHADLPLLYKITGVWGNHEGSMLLWWLILSGFGYHTAVTKDFTEEALRVKSLCIHGGLTVMIAGFVLFTSNPFIRLFPPVANGADLNPLLQDPGLAFHPPLLYLGYVGFSAVFSVATAALWHGKITPTEGRLMRNRCLPAWTALTGGIALGAWWAYYELGWGGFWFWDPVENASLIPWLSGTALLHSIVILQKRGSFKSKTVFLAILTFCASLLGTFIVRSGVIASVHSFASSPERGLIIMLIFLITAGGAFSLFALRGAALRDEDSFELMSREGALILNNYLIGGILFVVLSGLLYPLFLEAFTGQKISVGAPYYNPTVAPFAYGIALLLPVALFLPWRRTRFPELIKALSPALFLTLGACAAIYLLSGGPETGAAILILAGLWVITGSVTEILFRALSGPFSLKKTFVKIGKIIASEPAKIGAHIGVGAFFIGIAGATFLNTEILKTLKIGESFTLNGREFTLKSVKVVKEKNYLAEKTEIISGGEVFIPERRFYAAAGQNTAEADIKLYPAGDLYFTSGEGDEKGKLIRARAHPLIGFLWGGPILAVIGGVAGVLFGKKRKKSKNRAFRHVNC